MSSLHRNSLWLLCARLSAQGLAIVFIAIVARRLGVETFGQFTFIGAVVLIGNTFTNFGTDTYMIREVARTRSIVPIVPRALGLQLLLSLLWCVVTLFVRPSEPLMIYSLALFPLAVYSVATAALRAFERMDLVWTLSLTNGLLQLAAAVLAPNLWMLSLFLLGGQLILAAIAYRVCMSFLPNFQLFPVDNFSSLFKFTLPFASLTLLLVLSQRLGILAVSALLGDAETGIFSSVTRIVDGLKLGHYAVLGALLPAISRGTAESRQSFRKGFLSLIGLSAIFAVGLALFPRLIILTLYGDDFSSAVRLLSILGWSLVPYTISSFISYDLIARRHENTLVQITAISLGVFLVLYFWMIPYYNVNGAIYAALLGETLQAMVFVVARMHVHES